MMKSFDCILNVSYTTVICLLTAVFQLELHVDEGQRLVPVSFLLFTHRHLRLYSLCSSFSSSMSDAPAGLCGGRTNAQAITPEVTKLVNDLKSEILSGAGASSSATVTPVSFRTQVVAGLNYFVTMKISDNGNDSTYEARIFCGLGGATPQLSAVSKQ